ncbi:MAG: flagellar filament capping protein FliD [Rhodocyclaceae bacterium]|nr:flagellar filament capping protein FliD [Rhodocyclaceae bacterium]
MAAISSPGIGSNLDVNGIIGQLMAIEQRPLTALAQKEAGFQAKISAYGSAKGALSSLQAALAGLADGSKFTAFTTAFSESGYGIAAASTSASAGSHSLEIAALAQSHKLKSAAFTDTTSAVGTGTLTFQYGTYDSGTNTFTANSSHASETVAIDSQHSSLSGIRDAINAASIDVSASITNDGTGNRLVLTSKDTGATNSLKITVSDSSLDAFAYNPTGTKNMTETVAAQNASLTVDGIALSKASNTVTDAIDGVTLTLSKVTTSALTLTVSRDTSSVSSAVSAFVKAFNDTQKTIKELTAYNASTKQASVLTGDSTLRNIQSQLRNILNTPLTNAGGGLTTVSEIGISFQKDGSLALNTSKLSTVLADATKDVSTLFAAIGKPTDALVKVLGSGSATKSGNYALNITQAATQGNTTGSATPASYTITASSNDTLSLAADGTAASVTLAAGTYTPTTLAAEVQSKINGATAFSSAGIGISVGYNGVRGKAVGSAIAGLTIGGTNNTLTLSVDGTASGTITLTSGTYTATTLAAEIQNKINADATLSAAGKSVVVSQTGGVLTVTSDTYGTASSVTTLAGNAASGLFGTPTSTTGTGSNKMVVTSNRYGSGSTVSISGNAADNLLGAGRTDTTGVNVAGTIGGLAATGDGQTLTSTAGDPLGLKLQVTGTTAGDRGVIKFSIGYAAQLSAKLNTLLASDGAITSRTDGINQSITDIGKRRERLTIRLTEIEKRYRTQFTALDTLMSSMLTTSQYLQQQLANLPKAST